MKLIFSLTLVFASFSFAGVTHAALLIDTGSGPATATGATLKASDKPANNSFQYLGGQFTLSKAADITSVKGWMGLIGLSSMGRLKVKIHANKVTTSRPGGLPGKTLYARAFRVKDVGTSDNTGHWEDFTGFSWQLDPGTYWLTFEPVPGGGFHGVMPFGSAQNPLANPVPAYGYCCTPEIPTGEWRQALGQQYGFQIFGNQ